MADYYQNKYTNDLGEEFAEPIGFSDMSIVTPEIVISSMKEICEGNNIPASFRKVSLELSKGFFNKTTFCAIEISHPNPPQSYCKQLYVICPDGMRFFFVGSSKAFSEKNNYEAAMNGIGGNFKARVSSFFGVAPDTKPYELEMEWHNIIFTVFQSILE